MRLAGLVLVLGAALVGSALVMATPSAALVDGLPSLIGMRPTPTPVQPAVAVSITSQPSGATVFVNGIDAGLTPATVSVPAGTQVTLHRDGFLDTLLVNPRSQASAMLWGTPRLQLVRPPLPGGKIAGVDVLADGRVVLDLTVPTAPSERQAWDFDPVTSNATRLGPAILKGAAPAGVAVSPDGAHTVSLVRGVAPTNGPQLGTQPTPPDSLRLDGPDGSRPFVASSGLASGEHVLDLTWPPGGGSALLLSQRPVTGGSRFRLRRIDPDGSVNDLVDLPLAPVEASWVWAPGGQRVAFLVRTTALTLTTLDLNTGALRSVADLPADAMPQFGGLAPAGWLADGTLVFAGPVADDALTPPTTAQPTRSPLDVDGSQTKPSAAFGLYSLPPNQATPQRLGTMLTVAAGPVELPDGSVAALARDARDGTLVLRTLDVAGATLTEQHLGLHAPARFSVCWNLAHGRAVVLLPAEGGGIEVHIVSFGQEPAG
jgi:hypothetical protein